MSPSPSDQKNLQRIGFVLVPNFALMSYASATEPLRAANLLAGSALYEAIPLSADGLPVRSSSGLTISCNRLSEAGGTCHTIYVCAGGDPQDWYASVSLHMPLRKFARNGVRIGGISSGSYVLASAGPPGTTAFSSPRGHTPPPQKAFPPPPRRSARLFPSCGRR
ncbi:GlxA family transcriptional regulator, partial [Rhizobium sp. SEMIA 4085]|nr:GlxA family transcriptional regulator [Rhizobium sp. SEMIA 4085]